MIQLGRFSIVLNIFGVRRALGLTCGEKCGKIQNLRGRYVVACFRCIY